MKQLEIKIGEKVFGHEVPECWAEVSQEDFVRLVRAMRGLTEDEVSKEMVMVLTHMGVGEGLLLKAAHWYALGKELEWCLDLEGIDCLLVEELMVDGRRMVGYEPDFSNTTWEEFTTAESYAMRDHAAGVAAVMYRPERTPRDENKDEREDYSAYGTMNRKGVFAHLDADVLRAVLVNYRALRGRFVQRYPRVFDSGDGDGQGTGRFSWSKVTKMIVGEKIGDWQQVNRLPCDVVLSRIDTAIAESREREKRG